MRWRAGVVAIAVALACVAAGCSATTQTKDSSSSPSISPSASSAASSASPSNMAAGVKGALLVVRKEGGTWSLWRVRPADGSERRIGELPFRPSQALASLDRRRVCYIGSGTRLAVVDVASGETGTVDFSGRPIRSIDGATWVSALKLLIGGCRKEDDGWPDTSSLYLVDTTTSSVSSFKGLEGGEPSYAADKGSLTYVTRRATTGSPYRGPGPWRRETIRLMSSLGAKKSSVQTSVVSYIDAGRSCNTPLISPDGHYILNSVTGTDVRVEYELLDAGRWGATTYLTLFGSSNRLAAWGGTKVAFMDCEVSASASALAIFIYDTSAGAMTRHRIPAGSYWGQLDWSAAGDLAGGSAWRPKQRVYVLRRGRGDWIEVTRGMLPVWVD